MTKRNPKRMAQFLCNAKNALSKAAFELEQAEFEGASIPSEWKRQINEIRDKIKW